ncbi:PRK06851 family protein [Senegalia massiliensis]|jgi:Cdc6-like AAA superfamily ATPase|uniref:PRK06851 family protein n=1 Tax=Senegalia massiliensis TaxID=1720316 RepID=UPI0010316A0B|nr:PRK06851 family protein [Senegalia massiliensis]
MPVIKDYFPGGNTGDGFFSYYDYIIGKDANRIFLVKGGPGTGKSSLMKNIGREFYNRGYDLEYHHCSSDNNSIDAVVIPKIKVAMIDATSPHTIAAKNPGAVDEIINMGDFWDTKKMEDNKKEIISVNEKVSNSFKRGYKYLRAAKNILQNVIDLNSSFMDFGKINLETNQFISELFMGQTYSDKRGNERHLFGSSYTPEGFVNYTESVLSNAINIYSISGDPGTGKTTLFKRIYKSAIERGLDVEILHTPLIPQKIETIYIKDIKVGITINGKFKDKQKTLNLNDYRNQNLYSMYKEIMDEDQKMANMLIDKGIDNIRNAKSLHDELEKYYVENIDFEKVDEFKNILINRILQYTK